MHRMKLGTTVAALGLAACSLALPKALIVQTNVASGDKQGPIRLADAVAQALDEGGKLESVVWGISDPIFRAATLEGRLRETPDQPTPEQMQAAAKSLGCEYVVTVRVEAKATSLTGHIDLLKGSTEIWEDTQTMDPGRSSLMDLDNTVRSIARTWAVKIGSGPLRDSKMEPLPPRTPDPSPGQSPQIQGPVDTPLTSQPQSDTPKTLEEYGRLLASGQITAATLLLRQAIDANPADAKLRCALIQHLSKIGRSREAASEAKRALLLIPDSADLRTLAAKALLESGENDQAQTELNEALARDPENLAARAAVVDIDLHGLKAQAAIDHIDVVLKKLPSKDLYFRRAVANAILGDPDAVQGDLEAGAQASNWTTSEESTYALSMKVLDEALLRTAGDLRSLFQRAGVRREDAEVAEGLRDQTRSVQARTKLLEAWSAPSNHKNSHGKRRLALNLLAQALSGLKAYLADGNEDTLTDASIDLGEAIKQLSQAKSTLAAEKGSVVTDASPPVHLSY